MAVHDRHHMLDAFHLRRGSRGSAAKEIEDKPLRGEPIAGLFTPARRRMRGLRWQLDFERRLGVECRVIHAVPA